MGQKNQLEALTQLVGLGLSLPSQCILDRMTAAALDRAHSIGEDSSLAYLADQVLEAALLAGASCVSHPSSRQPSA